ncbi:MAG: Unknown protein, partial [uncultured Thiotrichaceae bacterium]
MFLSFVSDFFRMMTYLSIGGASFVTVPYQTVW